MRETRFATYCFAGCFALTVLVGLLVARPILGGNDASRWSTIWSLTHGRGYVIDDAPYGTNDKVRRDGSFWSSKPPLLPTLVAGLVAVIRAATGLDLPADGQVIIPVVLLLVNVVPYMFVIVLYGRLLERGGFGYSTSVFCLATAAWGTYLTSYSISLNNHTVAACASFFTIYNLIRIHSEDQTEWWRFALCGLFASWTVCNELPAAPFGLIVFLWLMKEHPRETWRAFAPVATVVFGAYFVSTWLATGSLVPNYVKFNSPLYMYEGSYWTHPGGIDAAADPGWFYLFNLTLGHHGIFSLSPVFLFAFRGMATDRRWTGIHRLGLGLTTALLLLYMVKSNNYGGSCHGARWFFWLIPFWLLGLPDFIEQHFRNRLFRLLALMALGVSILSASLAMMGDRGPWGTSWLHLLMRAQGWIDY